MFDSDVVKRYNIWFYEQSVSPVSLRPSLVTLYTPWFSAALCVFASAHSVHVSWKGWLGTMLYSSVTPLSLLSLDAISRPVEAAQHRRCVNHTHLTSIRCSRVSHSGHLICSRTKRLGLNSERGAMWRSFLQVVQINSEEIHSWELRT